MKVLFAACMSPILAHLCRADLCASVSVVRRSSCRAGSMAARQLMTHNGHWRPNLL